MTSVSETLTNGKHRLESWATGEPVYLDEPDFEGPIPEEEHEAGELFAVMSLDSYSPLPVTFAEFLRNQARVCRIRDENPWFVWLGDQIEQLAGTADFVRAQEPDQYEERIEVMSRGPRNDSLEAIENLKSAAAILALGHWGETAHQVLTAATTIERTLRA